MNQTFAAWDPGIHTDPEQAKRQKSALDKKLTPLEINRDAQAGTFMGSKKDYKTTLTQCECVDFARRHLPCKHMYRLAMELGLFAGEAKPQAAPPRRSGDVVEQVFSTISTLSEEEQEMFITACYHCGNDNKNGAFSLKIPLSRKLSDMGLVVIQKEMRVNAKILLDESIAQDAHKIHRAYRKLHPLPEEDKYFIWE